MDLKHTLRLINQLVQTESIDFRAVVPLMLGLSKLLHRKFSYLISEGNTTLDTLQHPFGDLDQNAESGKKQYKRREGGPRE